VGPPSVCRANISIETSEVLRRNRGVGFAAEDVRVTRWSWPPRTALPSACRGGIRASRAFLPLGFAASLSPFAAADAAASSYSLRLDALM
jgi:hypothetical protein